MVATRLTSERSYEGSDPLDEEEERDGLQVCVVQVLQVQQGGAADGLADALKVDKNTLCEKNKQTGGRDGK